MAVEDTTDTRLQGGISILHNIPLIKGLSAGASLKWKSYGMPRSTSKIYFLHGKKLTKVVSSSCLGS